MIIVHTVQRRSAYILPTSPSTFFRPIEHGQIYLGSDGNHLFPTLYTFTGNSDKNLNYQLQFGASVAKNSIGIDIEVKVTCKQNYAGVRGYTQVEFFEYILLKDQSVGSVDFRLVKIGRPVLVRCFGVSLNSSLTCPATANQTSDQLQFCESTSLSNPVTMIYKPAPVISFCDHRLIITNLKETVQLILSEPVEEENVTINCSVVSLSELSYCQRSGVSCCQESGVLSVNGTTLSVGDSTASITLITASQGKRTCKGVQCHAISDSPLTAGHLQYSQNSSVDSSSEVLVEGFMPTLHMEPEFITAYGASFTTLLYVDTKIDDNLEFTCRASLKHTYDDAKQSFDTPNCSSVFELPSSPHSSTSQYFSPWQAIDSNFVIYPDESYHVVRVSRLIPVSEEVQEIILTTCCSAPSTLIENGGLFASSVAVAVFGAFPNTTGGDTSGNPQDERLIPDPAYRELAPCPCDLTYLSCDTNCCCDPECSEETKSAFSVCISGVVGGQGHGVDLRRCGSEHFPKTDWFPMLCVVSEFNALLGQYYDVRPKLSNLGLLKTVLTEIQSTRLYSYRKTELRFDKPEAQHGYDLGTDVFFVDRDNISHKLPLPQNDYSGLCLDDSPVQFLRNSKANCPRKVTWETCSGSAVFSARMFAIPSSLSSPAYLQSHAMSASVRSELNVLRRVNIDVNYHCAGINHSGYFYDLNPDVGQQRSSTDLLSGLGDIDCYGLCNPDSDSSTCLRFNADITVEALPPLPSRCVNDTGFSMPDEPFFNTVTEVCENAVLDVRYRLHWSGQSITSFSADVVMGDVPQGIFTQKFSADFMHDARLQPNNSDLSLGLKRSFDRSGSPGYDWGKPVVSGCRENESASVNTKQEVQLAVFYPGVDTLCKNSRRRPLTFGEDLSSQCSLYLTVGQLSNCSLLRRAVLNYLNILMPANVIGRFGYNLPYVSDTWIPILRNYPESSSKALTPVTSSPGSQGTTQDSQHTNESTIIRPLDWLTGFCPNLATGVHLEILYAETGRNKNYPLREIIGASVRYSISDWNMACVVPFIAMCEVDSAIPQQFFIASSVRYIGVSQASTQPNILFYEIHKKETCASDSCYRFFHDFDTSVCHYDTCWQELLYPITKAYAGYEDLAYTRAVSLVFVLFTVGFLFAIKPWK